MMIKVKNLVPKNLVNLKKKYLDNYSKKIYSQGGDDMTNMLISQMEGKLDSWAIRWCYTLFKKNAYCIYPTKSYIDNIGMDGSGVHCGSGPKYGNDALNQIEQLILPNNLDLHKNFMKSFRGVYEKSFLTIFYLNSLKILRYISYIEI